MLVIESPKPAATRAPLAQAEAPSSLFARRKCALLILVPLAYLIFMVAKYSVDVPFGDQWEFVPVLQKTYQGNLSFPDLWAQHNEHRIFFARLIMLGLARLTHWSIRCELALNVLLAMVLFTILVWQIKRTARALGARELEWALPLTSLIVFSMSQFDNWLWGWQIQMVLSVLAALAAIVLLANGACDPKKFIGAAALGFVATHSFASGIAIWPIGLLLIVTDPSLRAARVKCAAIWSLLSAAAIASYVIGYQKPAKHPAMNVAFTKPLEYLSYVLKYLGSFCAQYGNAAVLPDSTLAIVFGLGALAILAWTTSSLIWGDKLQGEALRPYLAFCIFSILSALLTGIGRAGFGSDQAMESRYCTMTVPLWCSLMVFLILLARPKAFPRRPARLARWTLAIVTAFLVLSSALAIKQAQGVCEARSDGRAYLLKLAAHPGMKPEFGELFHIYPGKNPFLVMDRYQFLLEEKLSLFRETPNP